MARLVDRNATGGVDLRNVLDSNSPGSVGGNLVPGNVGQKRRNDTPRHGRRCRCASGSYPRGVLIVQAHA